MISKGSQVVEQPSWSSQSASPSPPPPPLPPPVVARWARTEQSSAESCPHCRGRMASLPTRTTSLSSYSACKDRSTPVSRPQEDEDSFPVICDRELHSLHRNVPALRRRDVDTATIKQHYYPEGGWGWLVCGAAFLAHLLTSGVQLAFGLLYLYTMKFLVKKNQEREFYMMATEHVKMNELRSKYVNVVLGVEEGKGMEFLKHSVYIIAHFNGRIMESDCVEPLPTPDFNTELVWETEKKTIRKVRSTNSPLRVECFSIDEYGKKECIGFTLLSLRSANIIPANKPDMQIPIKWYKLIGVPAHYKKSHPELYLSLTLRDHCINNTVPPAIPSFSDALEMPESSDTKVIPVKIIDGGYIQIGEDKNNEKFELKITVKLASNLDVLLPKNLVFSPNIDKFYMCFCLFGITINTKPFYRDLHETIILNENIVVKLQSTFEVLKIFFGQFYEVLVYFCHGTNKLASTKINMEKLIPPNVNALEFKEKYRERINQEESCVFQSASFHSSLYEMASDRKPLIQIESQLTAEIEKTIKISEKTLSYNNSRETIGSTPTISKESIRQMDGSGDRNKKSFSPICDIDCIVDSPKQIVEISVNKSISASTEYQQYGLDIILEGLIWRKLISVKGVVFKFKHPRASTSLSIKTEIKSHMNKNILLENLHCKLIYLTTPDNIFHLLETQKPILIIENQNGVCLCEQHYFNTDKLDQKECSYTTSLSDGKDILMDLKVWMCIQRIGLMDLPKTNYQLGPHILDDFLALKELHELHEWKKDVKDKFLNELKAKEKEQLHNLMQSWTERKNTLENKLITNVNRCKFLSKQLQRESNTLKIQKALQEKEQNCALEKIHEEVRKNAIKYSLNDNYDLLERISNVERENSNLKDMLAEQSEEINSFKKCSLSNQQTANLLQEVRCLEEKYIEAQKVKNYFKEQYAKAVKEIHQLKTEGQETLQNQLQIKKEELSQLSLDKFFEMHNANDYEFSEEILKVDTFNGDETFDYVNNIDKINCYDNM